ncbi:MAG TPA: NAD-dependent epimerase/dehydratase family protein [Candidatus Didemnitutus sp.]|jgi:UDP-glucose 4-epimerase
MASSPTIFITGARGRLATLMARQWEAEGRPLGLYSRRADGACRDWTELLEAGNLARANIVLHLAWSTLPASAEADPDSGSRHDLPYLEGLLAAQAACPAGQRPHLVFFSSGGTVYGNAPGRPSVEPDAVRPLGNYGRGKAAGEEMIMRASERGGLPFTILRISNPYGYPVPSARPQGIIPHAIRCAVHGQPLALWGDGTAIKDYLHCADLLGALAAVVDRPVSGIFNVSSGRSYSVLEVLSEVEAQVGRRILLAPKPAPPWDVHDSRLDNRKFVAATGWQPKIDLAAGIRRETAGSVPP